MVIQRPANGKVGRMRLATADGHRLDAGDAPGSRIALRRSPDDRPPFPVDAIVFEEDTGLVLNADVDIEGDGGHPIRIMTDLYACEARQPGEVIVQGRNPYRILAVVHDFEREPACREAWVADALRSTLRKSADLGVRALGLQMLGTRFGPFSTGWFLDLLGSELAASARLRLERIWLMDPADDD